MALAHTFSMFGLEPAFGLFRTLPLVDVLQIFYFSPVREAVSDVGGSSGSAF